MEWGRLTQVRTVLLIVVGLSALVASAFVGLGLWGGLAARGIACLSLEFMTGPRDGRADGAPRA